MFQEEIENKKNHSNETNEKEKNLGKISNEEFNSNFSEIESNYNKKNKELFNYIEKLSNEFNLPSPNENNNFSNDFEEEIELTLENKEKLSKILKNISLILNFNSNN